MKYCTHCGTPLVPGALFCTECGTPQTDNGAGGSAASQGAAPPPQTDGGYQSTSQSYEQPYDRPYEEPYRQRTESLRGVATERNIVVCLILTLITCGIYGLFWLVVLNDDLNVLSDEPSPTDGIMVIVFSFITCGIYGIYWLYKMGNAVDRIKHTDGNTGILYIVLHFVGLGIVNFCLMQDTINNAVR